MPCRSPVADADLIAEMRAVPGRPTGAGVADEDVAACRGWAAATAAARAAFVNASTVAEEACPATLGSAAYLADDPYAGRAPVSDACRAAAVSAMLAGRLPCQHCCWAGLSACLAAQSGRPDAEWPADLLAHLAPDSDPAQVLLWAHAASCWLASFRRQLPRRCASCTSSATPAWAYSAAQGQMGWRRRRSRQPGRQGRAGVISETWP
jgi:hypothetical protein